MRGSGLEGPPSLSRAQTHPWMTPLTPPHPLLSSVGRGAILEARVGQARVRAAGVLHPAPQHRRFQPRLSEGTVCHCVLALVVAPLWVLWPTVMALSFPMCPKGAHVAQGQWGTVIQVQRDSCQRTPTPRSSGAPLPSASPAETARHRAVPLRPHLPGSCGAPQRWHLQRGELRPGRGVPCFLASTLSLSDRSLRPGLVPPRGPGRGQGPAPSSKDICLFPSTPVSITTHWAPVSPPRGCSWTRRPTAPHTSASQAGAP